MTQPKSTRFRSLGRGYSGSAVTYTRAKVAGSSGLPAGPCGVTLPAPCHGRGPAGTRTAPTCLRCSDGGRCAVGRHKAMSQARLPAGSAGLGKQQSSCYSKRSGCRFLPHSRCVPGKRRLAEGEAEPPAPRDATAPKDAAEPCLPLSHPDSASLAPPVAAAGSRSRRCLNRVGAAARHRQRVGERAAATSRPCAAQAGEGSSGATGSLGRSCIIAALNRAGCASLKIIKYSVGSDAAGLPPAPGSPGCCFLPLATHPPRAHHAFSPPLAFWLSWAKKTSLKHATSVTGAGWSLWQRDSVIPQQ